MQLTKSKSSCAWELYIRIDGAYGTDFVVRASLSRMKTIQRCLREKLRRSTICGGAHWRLRVMH